MSMLAYPPRNDEEVFRLCTKECGIVTATEDFQYFTLGCIFCSEKFHFFDAFIGHMQTVHLNYAQKDGLYDNSIFNDALSVGGITNSVIASGIDNSVAECNGVDIDYSNNHTIDSDEEEDLTDADPTVLLEPQMVIKQELIDDPAAILGGVVDVSIDDMDADHFYNVKQELTEPDLEANMEIDDTGYMDDASYGYNNDFNADTGSNDDGGNNEENSECEAEDDETNYDDLVEESLLSQETGLTMHIKDRKMIKFIIDSYRRNTFLWDHRHPQFRDRFKRQQFLEWILNEFKCRFNISLAKDAITRKWDNLRTVYKRECNRMSLEKTNVSTLWYFKELHFLNRLYSYNHKMSDAVVKETVYRRRYSALWNDVSTSRLLSLVATYPCFYDKYNADYRSKDKRGEALQRMAVELQEMIDVTTIQISKRISQLRFDYSKQKQERLSCENSNKQFVPSYTYYDQMQFMDSDVAPFKCEHCTLIVQTPREMDMHLLNHQPTAAGFYCNVCHIAFGNDGDQFDRHRDIHMPVSPPSSPSGSTAGTGQMKEVKFHCDLCTASFREKSNYEEHMRRHNDELLLPTLSLNGSSMDDALSALNAACNIDSKLDISEMKTSPYTCDICQRTFASQGHLNSHRVVHADERERRFKCDYPHCGKTFIARQSLLEHVKMHYSEEEYKCDICGKAFKSTKNLQNHKQIHDAIKRYVCKICGSAFAQAAGLYLHKRRHNRPNARIRNSL